MLNPGPVCAALPPQSWLLRIILIKKKSDRIMSALVNHIDKRR